MIHVPCREDPPHRDAPTKTGPRGNKLLKDDQYDSKLSGNAFFKWAAAAAKTKAAEAPEGVAGPGKKRSSAYADFIKANTPLMKLVSEMWQKSHEKNIYMSSRMEQKSAKSKKAKESQGNAKKKSRREAAASTRPERVTL